MPEHRGRGLVAGRGADHEVACPTVDSIVARAVASAVYRTVDDTVARAVARAVDGTVARTVARAVDGTVARAVDDTVARAVARAVDGTVARAVDGTVARTVARAVASTVARAVGRAVDGTVDRAVGRAVDGTVARAVDGTVASTVARAVDCAVARAVDRTVDRAGEASGGQSDDRSGGGVAGRAGSSPAPAVPPLPPFRVGRRSTPLPCAKRGFRAGLPGGHGVLPASSRPARGLSLVEVAIAVLVLGVILVPVFSVFERSSSGTVQTRAEMLATGYADELLAWLQTLPLDHPSLAATAAPVPLNPPPELAGPLEPKFQRFLTVREFPPTAEWPFRYKLLTVQVSWTAGGPARETRLSALRYGHERP